MSEPATPPQPPAPGPMAASPTPARRKRAVTYYRVSTLKQANKDDDPEGYSVPAQREACQRKADSLDAEIVAEFVDRGESAKTADRRDFQRMLAFVKEAGNIDYVILDKVDRFARNRRDDANLLFELRMAGAQLVSVKENIDDTPAGQLLHAIMAGIAEFYSRNLATEALKGMTQKAKVGGTPGRAPIGYLNTRRRIDGREVATVVVDPERAPLVQWAFEVYATGEWTIRRLTAALAEKGLKALPHGRKVPGPLAPSHVARMLHNRYYIGYVRFKGLEYQGRHQPLVPESLFEHVQEVLRTHDRVGEKRRTHHHYLKSSVFCGECGSRLCLTNAKGTYLYFFCLGRQQHRTSCQQRYLAAHDVEAAVERYWATVRLPDELQERVQEGIQAELEQQQQRAEPEIAWARRRVGELDQERRRLARGVVTGAIPEDLAREEQERITAELKAAERLLAAAETIYIRIEETLTKALALAGRCGEVYALGGPQVRRMSNQFFFEKILVTGEEAAPGETEVATPRPPDQPGSSAGAVAVTGAPLREPWATLLAADFQARMIQSAANPGHDSFGRGSRMMTLVRRQGLEPRTRGLRGAGAPSADVRARPLRRCNPASASARVRARSSTSVASGTAMGTPGPVRLTPKQPGAQKAKPDRVGIVGPAQIGHSTTAVRRRCYTRCYSSTSALKRPINVSGTTHPRTMRSSAVRPPESVDVRRCRSRGRQGLAAALAAAIRSIYLVGVSSWFARMSLYGEARKRGRT
jgi:site-specific DNA recombinase